MNQMNQQTDLINKKALEQDTVLLKLIQSFSDNLRKVQNLKITKILDLDLMKYQENLQIVL